MKPKKPIDMSYIQTLMNGEQGLFKPKTLTPMQKLTLRFVVVGLVFYLFVVIEGMIMRLVEINPLPFLLISTSLIRSGELYSFWE